jgi:hypothetical protein
MLPKTDTPENLSLKRTAYLFIISTVKFKITVSEIKGDCAYFFEIGQEKLF